MASTVGAHPWNNSANQGDSDYIDNGREADEEGQEDEDVDREREEDDLGSESVGTIETLAPRLSTASFPRMVETVRHTRPSHLDQITFGRSHSLSAVGMGVSELRVSVMCCVFLRPWYKNVLDFSYLMFGLERERRGASHVLSRSLVPIDDLSVE